VGGGNRRQEQTGAPRPRPEKTTAKKKSDDGLKARWLDIREIRGNNNRSIKREERKDQPSWAEHRQGLGGGKDSGRQTGVRKCERHSTRDERGGGIPVKMAMVMRDGLSLRPLQAKVDSGRKAAPQKSAT